MKPEPEEERRPVFPMGFTAALIMLGLLLGTLTFYFVKKIIHSEKHLVPLGILTLMTGLIYEYKTICEKWKTVLITSLVAFIFSFCVFIDQVGRKGYILEQRIEMWPYAFCIFFVLIAALFNQEKTTPKSTEGMTLLQSCAMVYWIIDTEVYLWQGWFIKSLLLIVILFVLYSFFHAFTYVQLKARARFRLSIWSSLIMLLFSAENIFSLHKSKDLVETAGSLPDAIIILFQYFFLGVSAVYIVQNYIMLAGFLPDRRLFDKRYYNDVKDLKKQHISRFSEEQAGILFSFILVVLVAAAYSLNYYFNFVPRNIIIWTSFVLFPLVIHLVLNITRKKKAGPKHRIFRKDMAS